MEEYNQYSRGRLIQKIESLKNENKFLKEYIKGTKEFKNFDRWVKNNFGGEE